MAGWCAIARSPSGAAALRGRLYEQGDAQARPVLRSAIAPYGGDAFADDPYPDWTATLREHVRAAHLRALRTLARLARRAGDVDEAVARVLELLELDPYDEAAHADTVAVLTTAGRHGEARRARDRYADAMRALGIDA
jgi:DNA-binding SARP family transcriptional activator